MFDYILNMEENDFNGGVIAHIRQCFSIGDIRLCCMYTIKKKRFYNECF